MELHPGETVLFEGHPSWRSTLLFFAKGLAADLVIALIAYLLGAGWLVTLLIAGTGAAITIGLSVLIRQATRYMITDERLHIQLGLLSRKVQETRLGRVQNVTVTQSAWERLLRVGRAEFETASDERSDFVFAGIANPDQVRRAVDDAHRLAEGRGAAASDQPTHAPGSASGL